MAERFISSLLTGDKSFVTKESDGDLFAYFDELGLFLGGSGRLLAHSKDLTDNVATGVFNIAHADGSRVGGAVLCFVDVTDGVDHQFNADLVMFGSVRKGAAFTSAFPVAGNTDGDVRAQGLTGGSTLTVTYNMTAANPTVFQVTANTSLVPTTLKAHVLIWNAVSATIARL